MPNPTISLRPLYELLIELLIELRHVGRYKVAKVEEDKGKEGKKAKGKERGITGRIK